MNELSPFDKNINWLQDNMIQEEGDIKRAFDRNFLKLFVHQYQQDFKLEQRADFFHQAQLSSADPRKKEICLLKPIP